jgi:hypothetical protein
LFVRALPELTCAADGTIAFSGEWLRDKFGEWGTDGEMPEVLSRRNGRPLSAFQYALPAASSRPTKAIQVRCEIFTVAAIEVHE